jgi:hypothetical protein
LSLFEQYDSPVSYVLRNVGEEQGVRVWEVHEELCPSGICSTQARGFARYRNANHLSVPQSRELATAIERIVVSGDNDGPETR